MLQRSGWSILWALALGIGSTWLIYWHSRPVRAEELAIPPRLLETRAERERLQAEFAVARRAQEKLLPAASPVLPGFQFAAICLPSREVGGDLLHEASERQLAEQQVSRLLELLDLAQRQPQ
jgi:hypothetical protein